jgi:O-methyltransferase involved in polyketide biosynthesis
MDREKITLTGTQETMLATLYGKAMESRWQNSILRDHEADKAIHHIDYDFSKLKMRRRDIKSAAVRARTYDHWAERYIDTHPQCIVLHLGCGLDTRLHRVNPPPTVRWYDIDFPDVIDLRRRLYPQRHGQHIIAASATDPELLEQIPGDAPVLVIAEGLTPYLPAAEGVAMLRRITRHFPSGELVFDAYNRVGLWVLRRYGPVKASGARVEWSIGNPHDLETAIPGLVFDSEWWFAPEPEIEDQYSWLSRQLMHAMLHVTPIRRLGRGLRYQFRQTNPTPTSDPTASIG